MCYGGKNNEPMQENLFLHASPDSSPGRRNCGNYRRNAIIDRYMLNAPHGIPWGLFYAAARLSGPDPLRPVCSRAAPPGTTKTAPRRAVFSCNHAITSLTARSAVFVPGNINTLPGPFSPFLGRVEAVRIFL